MKNNKNRPGTMQKRPGTITNHENQPGTIKNQPGIMKNHENRPGAIKLTRNNEKPTCKHEKP